MLTTNVCDLNDDCLLIICGELKLKDQTNFALACKRFEQVFKEFSRLNYKVVPDIDELSEDEFDYFVRHAGVYVLECNDFEVSSRLMHIAPEFAQLKMIDMCSVEEYIVNLKNINKFNNLESIRLSIGHADNLNILMEALQDNSHIKKMDLYLCDGVWDLKNYKCSSIEELTLKSYKDNQSIYTKICASMTNLRKFTLTHINLTNEILLALIENCKKLEYLYCDIFDYKLDLGLFAEISNLKFLKITYGSHLNRFLLSTLVEKGAHQLEGLELHYRFTDEFVYNLNIIHHFKNLRVLSMHSNLTKQIINIKKVFLTKLEYVKITYNSNVDEFILQIVQDNLNLRLVNLENTKSELSKEFIDKLVDCLREQEAKHNRKNLPIFIKGRLKIDTQELEAISPYIKFYNEKSATDHALKNVLKELDELGFNLY